MTAFRFRLDKALDFRRAQLELAESRFRQAAEALAEADRRRANLAAACVDTESRVRSWRPVSGGDLAALGAFRTAASLRQATLAAQTAALAEKLEGARSAMMDARRRSRLLERLKQRRLEEWNAANTRELEELASESFLSQWNRRRTSL